MLRPLRPCPLVLVVLLAPLAGAEAPEVDAATCLGLSLGPTCIGLSYGGGCPDGAPGDELSARVEVAGTRFRPPGSRPDGEISIACLPEPVLP